MRHVVLLGVSAWLSACASTLTTSETTPAESAPAETTPAETTPAADEASSSTAEGATLGVGVDTTRAIVHAPALRADELLATARMASYLEDHGLRVASIDDQAMERWFSNKPSGVYLYAERDLALDDGTDVRGACQRVAVWDDVVLNQLTVVIARRGPERVVVDLGQESATVAEQILERGQWQSQSSRRLPVGTIAWDDAHIAYAEGAAVQEVACVRTVRSVLCAPDADPWVGPRGYCLDRALVVRPWLPAFVPHVGPVSPAYPDTQPSLPEGRCEVECEPSACEDARERAQLPRRPLYAEQDLVLAAFRAESACRAFASSRGVRTADGEAW